MDRFSWRSYDINTMLPSSWQNDILSVAQELAMLKILRPRSVTSREGNPDLRLPVRTVNGRAVREHLPWLYALYRGAFRDLAQLGTHEPVTVASSELIAINLNVQTDGARYEAHVDSNPIECLLYCTDHPKGSGGELVVANNPTANSIAEIDSDCSIVYPASGHLVYFDARRFAHYVRPLVTQDAIRVVVAMNYYTPSCPESSRPSDLTPHLFGEQPEDDRERADI